MFLLRELCMPELSPEDQKKVDEFVSSNVNTEERPPFRPLRLLLVLLFVLLALTGISFMVAHDHGVM